jgi:asparagine synthase (glutamine-hydrolysing)
VCGIVGYAGNAGAIPQSLLVAMRDALTHRGPDAAGLWSSADGAVILGHRRLSIIDLSATGAQPMVSADGRFVVVFNGEIYNHDELRVELAAAGVQFRGSSDTEVLLAAYVAWGERCVPQLRGMFAFAIYDNRCRVLFMARDRAGEKPLYWTLHRGGIVFASELKALMVDPEFRPRLSAQGASDFLAFGYVAGDHCILHGVHKLRPAHCLTWSLGSQTPTIVRYWDVPAPASVARHDRVALTHELQTLLSASVREQLIADVPVAVLLSGGVDSSIVTALAAAVSHGPVRTFTVTIPQHPDLDESRFARQVASQFRTDHVELPLDGTSVDLIEALARQYDEPIADSSMIPTYLLAKTVSQHCKVVLGGDGGDELFGGYVSYQSALRRDRLRHWLPAAARSVIAAAAAGLLPPGARGRNGLISLRGGIADGIAQAILWYDDDDLARISPWLAGHMACKSPRRWRHDLVESSRGIPGAAMAADFLSYLPDDILVKVDRASMLCSLEVRAPFLDSRVVEFAFRDVPNALRTSADERKILLKTLARQLLPVSLDINRKQGFTIPISTWLTRVVIRNWLEECQEQLRCVFAAAEVRNATANPTSAADYHRLYAMMMLTWWMRHYRVAV